MAFGTQLKLLLWKNFTLRKKEPVRIIIEVLVPLTLFVILAWVKISRGLQEHKHECHFDGKSMPSAGPVPFIQSFLCTYRNNCHRNMTATELPGVIQNFNSSLISQFFYEFEELLNNQSDINAITNLLEDLNTFQDLFYSVSNGTSNCTFQLGSVLVDPDQLRTQILNQNISLDQDVITSLINAQLNSSVVIQILEEYYMLLNDPSAYVNRLQELALSLPEAWTENQLTPEEALGLGVLTLQQLLSSQNVTATDVQKYLSNQSLLAIEVRNQLCGQNQTEYLIVLTDANEGQRLINELCALDMIQFTELVNDIGSDIDPFKLLEQVQNCSNGDINFNERAFTNGRTLLSDFVQLEVLAGLLQQVNATFGEALIAFNWGLNTSTTNITMGLAELLCGQNEDLISMFERQVEETQKVADQLEVGQEQPLERSYTYDNSTSKFCNDLFESLEQTSQGRLFWQQVKPLIRGKIPYTPDNQYVREILQGANSTFAYYAIIQQFARDWLRISPNLTQFLESDTRVEILRDSLDFADYYINNRTGLDPNAPSIQEIVEEYVNDLTRQAQDANIPIQAGLQQAIAENLIPQLIQMMETQGVNISDQDLTTLLPLVKSAQSFLQLSENTTDYTWRDFMKMMDEAMDQVQKYIDCVELDKFEPISDEDALVQTSMEYIQDYKLWAGVVFEMDENIDSLPSHIKYKIRQSVQMVDTTAKFKVLDRFWTPGSRSQPTHGDMKYIMHGFSYLQDMISHSIIRLQTNISMDEEIGINIQQFPYPCWIRDTFTLAISRSMPMFMVLAWIYSVSMIVKGIVYEKEKRLKEVMKVMGLGNAVHWVAWFITSFITMFITVVLLVIILKTGKILEHSDASVIFVFMMVFLISTIMFSFMVSVFFSKANLAAACAGVLYFTSYLPYSMCTRWEEFMTLPQKATASFFNTVAFSYGCSYFSRYEEQGVGIQWHNINKSVLPDDEYSMLGCMMMMILDSLIYGVITWYVEAVFPGQYGMPRPWYFFVTRSYWCGDIYNMDDPTLGDPNMEMNQQEQHKHEKEPTHLPLGVSVRGMKKVYKRGKKVAVDGLSLNFYEGQITSFLGHNGAGKTTTMSILTGLFPPTEGTAYVYTKDIRTNMDQIRQSMGMCPQHNVLFDRLTVQEHLWFYARLKGMDGTRVRGEIKQMIDDTGLQDKRNEQSKNLSGGMKRKLSIAIAFVAGSKVVILDEPTAGVDPHARRSIWELLLKYKKDRTIIMSTHFMDEADILGDRIAIISQGKLCFSGSSLFLKSNLGNGYYLTLVKKEEEKRMKPDGADDCDNLASIKFEIDESVKDVKPKSDDLVSEAGSFDESVVTTFIQKFIPDAKLKENIGSELTYQLPDDKHTLGIFEDLFQEIDNNLNHLGLSSYGISDTTLEEVFLKVAEETGVDEELNDEEERNRLEDYTHDERDSCDCLPNWRKAGAYARPVTRLSFRRNKPAAYLGLKKKVTDERTLMDADGYSDSGSVIGDDDNNTDNVETNDVSIADIESCNGAGSYRVEGKALIARQFLALVIKRFHVLLRSKKGFVAQIVMPAIFICLAQLFTKLTPSVPTEPPMEIHPWHLQPLRFDDDHLYMFYSNDDSHLEWTQKIEQLLQRRSGLGNRCMNPAIHTIDKYTCLSEDDGSVNNVWSSVAEGVPVKNCSCQTGIQVCPANAGGAEPAKKYLDTTDYLYNMTGKNISDWLLKTQAEFIKKRYGGLSIGERNDLILVNRTEIEETFERLTIAANGGEDLDVDVDLPPLLDDLEVLLANFATKNNAKVWFNNKGYVSMVAYMNVMNNLVLRANLPPGSDIADYGITVVNHPVNRTRPQLAAFALETSYIDVLIAIAVIFAMSSVPASFVLFLIQERVSGSKHLQFVSGVNPTVYWVANFTWDMFNYILACTICIIIFLAFQVRAYVSPDNIPCLIMLLLLYGWSITPLMYPSSFFFTVPSTAFVAVQCFNLFVGFIATIATFILEILALEGDQELYDINEILRKVFLIFPQYCLGRGLIDMTRNQIIADAFATFGEDRFQNPFLWDIVGKNLFALALQGVLFFAFTLGMEYGFFIHKLPFLKKWYEHSSKPNRQVDSEDLDVARERKRVLTKDTQGDTLTVEGLTKVYRNIMKKNHTAVNNVCVGVHQGECFGLLGVNGAGKTSTFKMLTGDTRVSKGDAHLAGHSILSDMTSVHQNLGYCPQFDALCSLLTGRENLELYARLRGVPEKDVKVVSAWGIKKLGLTRYATKYAGDLSGGNKRKLSTAIALVGNPPAIFLDEPTTGMDPKARRFLWNCIANVIRDGRSVVLTSHSMEECEALCGRIAIMVNGAFKCIGSVQHLKNRFGGGYTVILRVSGENPNMNPVMEFFTHTLPTSVLKEKHHNMLQYHIGSGDTSLAKIFGAMESVRQKYHIEDYSVSQTTLDQVFINFANQQKSDRSDDDTLVNGAVAYNGPVTFTNSREAGETDAIGEGRYMTLNEEASISGSFTNLAASASSSQNSSFRSNKALFSNC